MVADPRPMVPHTHSKRCRWAPRWTKGTNLGSDACPRRKGRIHPGLGGLPYRRRAPVGPEFRGRTIPGKRRQRHGCQRTSRRVCCGGDECHQYKRCGPSGSPRGSLASWLDSLPPVGTEIAHIFDSAPGPRRAIRESFTPGGSFHTFSTFTLTDVGSIGP